MSEIYSMNKTAQQQFISKLEVNNLENFAQYCKQNKHISDGMKLLVHCLIVDFDEQMKKELRNEC